MDEHAAPETLENCRATMQHDGGMAAMHHPDRMVGDLLALHGGMLLPALLSVALLLAIGLLITWLVLRRGVARHHDEARRALDLRYAAGQIDRDTYLGMRADLAEPASGGG